MVPSLLYRTSLLSPKRDNSLAQGISPLRIGLVNRVGTKIDTPLSENQIRAFTLEWLLR
jgi:hypothetical protein